MYAADVAKVSVIICKFVVQNLHVISPSACVLNLGKLSEVSGLNTVFVSVELLSLCIANVSPL